MEEDSVVHIERQAITKAAFDDLYHIPQEKMSLIDRLKAKSSCSTKKFLNISKVLPIVWVLRYYNIRNNLASDILAGIYNGLYFTPHALAFGLLTSVKEENGLYTSIWPVFIYALFGTSKHVSVGTSSVICVFIANIVDRQSASFQQLHTQNTTVNMTSGDMVRFIDYKENISTSVSLLSGLFLIVLSFLRFGFISHFLSEPFLKAFTSGAAIHIVVDQLALIFGINTIKHGGILKLGHTLDDVFQNFTNIKGITLLVAILSICILIIFKSFINRKLQVKRCVPIPAELLVIILAVIVSSTTSLNKELAVVGEMSGTIPKPKIPDLSECYYYIVDCFVLALLIHANNIRISTAMAKMHKYEVDSEQEMLALGISQFVGAFLHCFPSSVSYQRSKMLSLMNVKSTLSGIIVALFMLVILAVSPYIFEFLPKATLSAIILVSMKGLLIQIIQIKNFWQISKSEFIAWLSTFFSVVLLDLTFGFLIGLAFSLIITVVQTQSSRGYRVGKTIENKIMVEHKQYRGSMETNGVKIFRFHSNIYYANAEIFRNTLYRKTVNPRKLLKYLQKQEKQRLKQMKIDGKLPMTDSTSDGSQVDRDIRQGSDDNIISIMSDVPAIMIEYKRSVSLKSDGLTQPMSRKISEAPSMASTGTSITDDGYEIDPDDGQEYVTEKKFDKMRKVHHIILDLSTVNYMDLTGAKMLGQISTDYGNADIKLFISGCYADVYKTMEHAGVLDSIPNDNIFIDLHDALVTATLSKRQNYYPSNTSLEPMNDIHEKY